MDIGSSKPDRKVRQKVKHHLIDIVEPDFHFTAGHFCNYALKECNYIFEQDKFPLFVGGTAFYIDAFFKGLSDIPELIFVIVVLFDARFTDDRNLKSPWLIRYPLQEISIPLFRKSPALTH